MHCPDCDHENTSGAWLCINCGAKLPREGATEQEQDAGEGDQPDEPSRFEPAISENLRRLRERAQRPARSGSGPSQRRSGQMKMPEVSSGTVLGFPLSFWLVAIFIFVVTAMVLSNLN